MMKNLLIKELRLAMHPTVLIFLGLSLMMLIPNYPFYVTLFYMALGLFFVCLSGRENHDIEYTLALPVQKRDVVRSRMLFAVLAEGVQLLLVALISVLRSALSIGINEAGMDANTAFLGIALILMGAFNYSFFTGYYRAPEKVGKAFAYSAAMFFIIVALAEFCTFAVPFVRERLDTPDPLFMPEKLATLAIGAAIFAVLTWTACRKAEASLEALDL